MRKTYSNISTRIDVVVKAITKLRTVGKKRECIGRGPLKNIETCFTGLTKRLQWEKPELA